MDIYIRQSKLSVKMKYLGFVWRVLRRLVWETATDTTTGLAAQMAYLLLFALAPGRCFSGICWVCSAPIRLNCIGCFFS